jgi:hypothetical protein
MPPPTQPGRISPLSFFQNSQQQPFSLSFLPIKSSATYLFFSTEQERPPTPSLNFVYRKDPRLDPNSCSKNIKSASSSISMISESALGMQATTSNFRSPLIKARRSAS